VILLGCGVPLGASFMLMDYCRIGCDVGGDWDSVQRHFHDREYISTFRSLTSTLSRWAMSGRFFGNDPDVFFVRDWKLSLNQAERWSLMLLNHLLGHLVFCSDPLDINRMSHEQKVALDQFFPWCSTPDVATPPHQVARVLQPVPTEKDLYFVQVHAQGRTYVVASNLSSKRQTLHLSTMDRIISKEAGEAQPQRHTSVYFQASTNQFGLASAAYSLKSHETCVFLRVVDSEGQLCSTARDGGKAVENNAPSGELHLMATKGGHVLPTTEVEAFGRHFDSDGETEQYQAKFRPSHFGKQVHVWLAWHDSKKDNGVRKGVVEGKSLNGKTLKAHPEIVLGHGIREIHMADLDIDRFLEVEASAIQKDAEVERIMACFKLDPFDILELDVDCLDKDIKVAYRKKSLMIHPDKVQHPLARDAFDLLKKAETDLMDPARRSFLISIIDEAKFETLVKQKTKDLLIEVELRKRKLMKKEMEAEGEVARKQDEVMTERKRKQEAQKVWEDSRDDRVHSWRNFQAGKTSGGKIKKKKPSTFRPPKAQAEDSTPYSKRPTTSSASEGF
ncbi:hypothetical protein BG000_001502, partial [Podila horticola]